MARQIIKTVSYIKKTYSIIKETKETVFYNDINVFVTKPLPEEISLNNVLKRIEQMIPKHMVDNIDAIYVGHFEEFDKREVNAFYQDGALYITNQQDDEEDMIDDIVHETSHAVEERYGSEIYGDGKLKQEFLLKRKKLAERLKAYGYYDDSHDFMNAEYDKSFDDFLYNQIGYDKLQFFTLGLFPSNYSATSLREYFGIGFEKYFLGEKEDLVSVSPILYKKIKEIDFLEENW